MKRNWFAAELHCHTIHSDGKFTPEALMKTAKERLLDGIALTDHNTSSGVKQAAEVGGIALLPGIELTTFHGHMPVLAPRGYIEWRGLTPADGDILVERAVNSGGVVGIAHPFQLGTPICTGGHWDYTVRDMSKINYMEIWSEGCPYLNSSNRRAIALWHSYLDRGLRITPTMGRDWHKAKKNVYPAACTYLGSTAETLSPETMLLAVKTGRTVISAGPKFFFETEDGKTSGDSVKAGQHKLAFHIDYTRSDILNTEKFVTKKLILRTNGEKILCCSELEYRTESFTADVTLAPSSWVSAELWGDIGKKTEQLIAVTAAIYSV